MLTIISKVFIFLCLLCLYENREYPSSFQNKSVSLIAQAYSVPGQTEGRREAFLEWTSKYLSFKPLSLTCEGNVDYCKNVIILVKLKGRGKPFLEGARREATLWDYPQEHLVVIRDEKVSPFEKFEIILTLTCFVSDALTNKHYRTWNSMISLWIDSKAYQ